MTNQDQIKNKSPKRKHEPEPTLSKPEVNHEMDLKRTKTVLRETDWQAPRVVQNSSDILYEHFTDIRLMMESANGILFSATEKVTGLSVCLKKVKKADTHSYKRLDSGCLMPSEFYFHFKAADVSSTVVKPLAWLESRKYYLIVMERPEDSIDLFEFTKEFGTLSEEAALNILSQLVECSKLLHEAGICHRDIKDENILFDPATWKIKLIDFGSATFATGSKYHSPQGTTDYFPPEFFLEDAYAPEPLTIWSILLYNADRNCLVFRAWIPGKYQTRRSRL